MKIDKYEIREDRLYSKEHEWAKVAGAKRVLVGVTDYGAQMLHEVVYVSLPKVGSQVGQMESLGTLESIKAVADVYSPFGGRVARVNEELQTKPELVNQSPYEEGWIVELEVEQDVLREQEKSLLDPGSYATYIQELLKKPP